MSVRKTAIIGGGIIGLAVAREIVRKAPGVEVTVFEKETAVGTHQTGHNSGVVHAGLYYEPGSLKAALCRRGVGLLEEFVRRNDIRYEKCGKLVVAQNAEEQARLHGIHERATANGVPGIRLLAGPEIADIEPNARGLAALHSPETAIVDYPAVARTLAAEIETSGGTVLLGRRVTRMQERSGEVLVYSDGSAESFDLVIACAGLQSDRLAVASGEAAYPRIVPFYGDYFVLDAAKTDLVKGLIYPVPDPKYPFLGVHLTRTVDDTIILGPNAFLSPGRESYRRGRISPRDTLSAIGFPGFWRFAANNIPAAIRETRTAFSAHSFVEQARTYVPAITTADVHRGPRGIRAQAMNRDGTLEDDFAISGTPRTVHVRNAPSPGATSALAIAEHIVHEALTRLDPPPG
ncbi:L-2-hydroxyglutarate oxidase [Nocardia macrotermitis]|uniref:L-2-hydroxyglutarate oxidase LhgO n=1 Tax=Nocardia macrotermitis TaxID=2585198 RepID=A0A7K0D766_9NOCA|nr:L-2-hydroxyglutarate oxidase [Nocardia macrotermitis]MQY21593.1 L-2-hydroxyglutarate oxidase LhgO [Nocardia macrotermitis]